MRRFFLIGLLAVAGTAQAQKVGELGELAVTPSTVHYTLSDTSRTVSRDLMASLPRAGTYQHTGDDIALLVDWMEYEGIELELPPFASDSLLFASDSLESALDSLDTAAGAVHAELARMDSTIAAQSDSINALQAQVAYTLQRVREILNRLER